MNFILNVQLLRTEYLEFAHNKWMLLNQQRLWTQLELVLLIPKIYN